MNLIPDDLLTRSSAAGIDAYGFSLALVISVLVAVIISGLYQAFYENRTTGSQIHRSFLLISPSITALFIAIQFSLPLSLGLLGALSFVRFRTPIKEPEEVGFLMLVIASSVICATFNFVLLLVLLILATITLWVQRYSGVFFKSKRQDGLAVITLDAGLSSDALLSVVNLLEKHLPGGRVESLSYGDDFHVINYSFADTTLERMNSLHARLNDIALIQKVNILFNRQGTL